MSDNIPFGVPINIVQDFWMIDPLTEAETPADPTAVKFTITAPNGDLQVFDYPGDSEVTNPQVGVFVCALDPPTQTGTFQWEAEGTGAVIAVFFGSFVVGASEPVPGPTLGPCVAWVSGEEVAACCELGDGAVDPALYDTAAVQASQLLFELSGRQFSGLCRSVVRPCRDQCSCFGGAASLGLGPWFWTSAFYGGLAWAWRNECGDLRGCKPSSRVKLAGYPVREIEQVLIDGSVLDPLDDLGNPNYRLEGWKSLRRMAAPGPPVVERMWPACQDMDLDSSQPGTFEITYRHGVDPPPLGVQAAGQLACELFSACVGGECKLPNHVVRVIRQGVTFERVIPLAQQLRDGATGLMLVDAFIAAYNPTGARRRPAVFSPDITQYPLRISSGPA